MEWEVEYTDEFGVWWETLTESQQEDLMASVILLRAQGPMLGYPHSSAVFGSAYEHMRELRTQSHGHPLRTLYAFDPRRVAILLIGGDKTGDNRWYERMIPRADSLYAQHLKELEKEGLADGKKDI